MIKRVRSKKYIRDHVNAYRAQIKLETFQAYGGPKCVWCGDDWYLGLSLDHINNDGNKHRKMFTKGKTLNDAHGLRIWLKKHSYPPIVQVLCSGCNCAKQVNSGVLPEYRHNMAIKAKLYDLEHPL